MTNRLLYKPTWAQGGLKKDPDTDTAHPSYKPNRYETIGWTAEKPPEEWENFLNNITEEKVKEFIMSGIPIWGADVTYRPGAFVFAGAGNLYRNDGSSTSTAQNPANGAPWVNVMAMYKDSVINFVKEFVDEFNKHMATANPHGDTIEKAGGVNKSYVDTGFGDPNDNRTIVYHTNRTGRVHSETPAQVGTLPASGGVFTGLVSFLKEVIIRTDIKAFMQMSQSTGMTDIMFSNVGVHVDANGGGYTSVAGVMSRIVSEGNFVEIQNIVNRMFVLPAPNFSVDLEHSLCDLNSIGKWIITTTKDAVFDKGKGFNFSDNVTMIQNFGFSGNTNVTTYFVGSDATKDFAEFRDTAMGNIGGFSNFLNNLHNGATNIRLLVIYPRLSNFQKSTLVTY